MKKCIVIAGGTPAQVTYKKLKWIPERFLLKVTRKEKSSLSNLHNENNDFNGMQECLLSRAQKELGK